MATNDFSTLGGAYSILGQATTAEYNRRRREEDKARRRARRDARREQLLAYLAKPILDSAGTAIAESIQSPFTEKHNEFFRNEEIQKRLRSQKRSRTLYEQLTTTRGTIDATGLSEEAYFTKDSLPQHVAALENEYRKKGYNPIHFALIIDGEARKRAEKSGKDRAAAFKKAFAKGKDLYSEEQINAYLQKANTNPKNIWHSIGRKVKSFFSEDDTQEQRDEKALNSLQGTPWAKSNTAFKEAMVDFRKSGGNFDKAMQEWIDDPAFGTATQYDPNTKKVSKKQTIRIVPGTGKAYVVTNIKTENPVTGETTDLVQRGVDKMIIDDQGKLNEKAILDKQMTLSQWQGLVRNAFTQNGYNEFMKYVNKQGYRLGNMTSLDQYRDLQDTFQTYLSQTGYSKDPEESELNIALVATLMASVDSSADLLRGLIKARDAAKDGKDAKDPENKIDVDTLTQGGVGLMDALSILKLQVAQSLYKNIQTPTKPIATVRNWNDDDDGGGTYYGFDPEDLF